MCTPKAHNKRGKEALAQKMRDMAAAGHTQAQIGDAVGLSQRRVGQILEVKAGMPPKASKKRERVRLHDWFAGRSLNRDIPAPILRVW